MGYITIDSSTSSTTVLVFDDNLNVLKRFQKEHKQIYTKEGYIEHDLEEIFQNLIELVKQASLLSPDPKFISVTNQRETFYASRPLTNADLKNIKNSKYGNGDELFVASLKYIAAAN